MREAKSRKVIMSVGEYTCNSQTTSEGSESTLLVAFFRLTAKRKSLVKCREMQPSFEVDYDVS